MNSVDLKKRTRVFAGKVIQFVINLPKNKVTDVLGNQLLRSACSVGANYRAACRAKSRQDFIFKIKIVEEEIDESYYWFELIEDSGLTPRSEIAPLIKEAKELTAIFTAILKTTKDNTK